MFNFSPQTCGVYYTLSWNCCQSKWPWMLAVGAYQRGRALQNPATLAALPQPLSLVCLAPSRHIWRVQPQRDTTHLPDSPLLYTAWNILQLQSCLKLQTVNGKESTGFNFLYEHDGSENVKNLIGAYWISRLDSWGNNKKSDILDVSFQKYLPSSNQFSTANSYKQRRA